MISPSTSLVLEVTLHLFNPIPTSPENLLPRGPFFISPSGCVQSPWDFIPIQPVTSIYPLSLPFHAQVFISIARVSSLLSFKSLRQDDKIRLSKGPGLENFRKRISRFGVFPHSWHTLLYYTSGTLDIRPRSKMFRIIWVYSLHWICNSLTTLTWTDLVW